MFLPARRRWPLPLLALLFSLSLLGPAPSRLRAQGDKRVNVLPNASFENVSRTDDNLWDGVDADGNLSGFQHNARVVTDREAYGNVAMPPSVAFVDLNGDGKPDLLTADPTGYFRFFPNRGTANAPRFTNAELLPLYLSTAFHPRQYEWTWNNGEDVWRFCPRVSLADWRKKGLLDLVVGNYYGELFFLPNLGKPGQPIYRQPVPIDAARIFTSEKNRFWANLLSPVAYDWNNDGRPDLITGEGTYSANAVHLLENVVGGDALRFTDARHSTLAYGDGREQLMPAVVDFDGDGTPDLLVADRNGEVGVYLNPGPPRPGAELKRVSTLSFGGTSTLPGLVSLCAADYNGDGLFDLIIGLPNGHVAVSLNTGTKTQPAFGPLQDIKGEDRLGRNVRAARDVVTTTFPMYGNALGYFTVVTAQDDPDSKPTDGNNCLKAGYWPQAAGTTFGVPPEGIPGASKHFTFWFPNQTLDVNKPYGVSLRVKNFGMERMRYSFISHYSAATASAKIERGERGEMKNRGDYVDEWVNIGQNFSATGDWKEITGSLVLKYQNPKLQDLKQMTGSFEIEFYATNLSSVIYFDDVKLLRLGK